jgi:hypothetical protein
VPDESSSKRDVQAIVITLLRVSPLVLVIIYLFVYTYALQFLAQFSVTPEDVGISEIKLLTRAASFTLVVISIYGILFVLISLLAAIPDARFTRIFKRTRWRDALSLVGLTTIGILLTYVLDLHLNIGLAITYFIIGMALGLLLYYRWEQDWARYAAWTGEIILITVLLAQGAYFGGAHSGHETASTGRVSPLVSALGVDVVQVYPEWSNSKDIPSQYAKGQDLLELGSDDETTFLYDCRTITTYRIPLNNVVLTYSLTQTSSTALRSLHCR